ncbi:hypothetical protein LINGRAHAP2_LOCUS24621 [Linum grandiflorum]
MLPNIELIVAALIHGVLIASVVMVAVLIVLSALSMALLLMLFSIPILDLHDAVSLLSRSSIVKSIEANFQLGSVLVLYFFISYAAILRGYNFDIRCSPELLDSRGRRRISQSHDGLWSSSRWLAGIIFDRFLSR